MTFPQTLTPVSFLPGQRLLADDLDDAISYEQRMLAAHVRLAHAAWGVAAGLEVTLRDDVAHVASGHAYDVYGRALQLSKEHTLPCEAGKALVLRPCVGDETGRPAWRAADDARPGVDVVLDPRETGLGRRGAPAMTNPYLAAGTQQLKPTEDGAWVLSRGHATAYLGFDFDVTAASASFTTVPCYFATIARQAPEDPAMLPLLVAVAAPTRAGFRLQVMFVTPGAASPRTLAAAADALGSTTVQWLGIEP